jgi:RNA recognition motif-containing protein
VIFLKGERIMEEERKIYIGNLEYSVAEGDLARILEEKGINAKEITVIMDKYSGRSKGFGFVEFETEEEAQKAIDALNGQELNGRTLKVSKARKMKPRRDFGSGGYSRGRRY